MWVVNTFTTKITITNTTTLRGYFLKADTVPVQFIPLTSLGIRLILTSCDRSKTASLCFVLRGAKGLSGCSHSNNLFCTFLMSTTATSAMILTWLVSHASYSYSWFPTVNFIHVANLLSLFIYDCMEKFRIFLKSRYLDTLLSIKKWAVHSRFNCYVSMLVVLKTYFHAIYWLMGENSLLWHPWWSIHHWLYQRIPNSIPWRRRPFSYGGVV